MRDTENRTLAIIVPAYNEAHQAESVLKAVASIIPPLKELGIAPQLVVVDDGSDDGTLEAFKSRIPGKGLAVRLIRFHRNFGKDAAMLAGLSHAECDFYVFVDADGQTPFSLIPKMAQTLLAGSSQVVYAVKEKESYSPLRRLFTNIFFWIGRRLGIRELEKGLSDFIFFRRSIRDRILSLHEHDIVVRNMIRWMHEPAEKVFFTPGRAAGSRWSIRQLFGLGIRSILSFSHVLRINFFFALFYWIFSLIFGTIIVYQKITGKIVVGLSSTVILTLFSFGLLFFMIAIIGEYLIALYEEVKRRPRYSVASVEDIGPI